MEIIVDKKLILSKFLIPLNKITEQAIVSLNKESISCISYSSNDKQSIIFYSKLNIVNNMDSDETISLNIGSVRKLINALSCISLDIIPLRVEKNSISYSSPETSFKFHLKEDGVIPIPAINLVKIQGMTFDTSITIPYNKFNEVLKASSYTEDSNKVYFNIIDNKMYAELTDKTISNIDNMSICLSNEITGNIGIGSVALRMDVFKLLSSLKFDNINIGLSSKGIVAFIINEDNYLMKYITSSLIK